MNKGEDMTKKEFLKELNDALQGEVPRKVQEDTLNYYGNYIKEEVKKGTKEEQVLSMLGSGRIIAKSIIEVHGGDSVYEEPPHYDESTDSHEKKGFHQEFDGEKTNYKYGRFTLNSWYGKALLVLLVVIIFVVIFAVLGAAFSLLWRLLPILFLIGIILWVVGIFTKG